MPAQPHARRVIYQRSHPQHRVPKHANAHHLDTHTKIGVAGRSREEWSLLCSPMNNRRIMEGTWKFRDTVILPLLLPSPGS